MNQSYKIQCLFIFSFILLFFNNACSSNSSKTINDFVVYLNNAGIKAELGSKIYAGGEQGHRQIMQGNTIIFPEGRIDIYKHHYFSKYEPTGTLMVKYMQLSEFDRNRLKQVYWYRKIKPFFLWQHDWDLWKGPNEWEKKVIMSFETWLGEETGGFHYSS